MGRDLYESFESARALFDQAERIVSMPLKKLCFEGPSEELSRTDVSQPAIFTVSMATLKVMESLLPADGPLRPAFCGGLSLGEYTALCVAGSISFSDGLALVAKRGLYMQEAATQSPGGMVSLLGADEEAAEKVCEAAAGDGVLAPANFNCPGQIVLSGTIEACQRALQLANECGARGAVPLDVAGAFHSRLMQPAADRLGEALAEVEIAPPTVPVLSNVTGRTHGPPEEIRRRLLEQVTSPVRWQRNCELLLAEGVNAFLEIGPGRVLAGLMKRIDRSAKVTCLNGADAVADFVGIEGAAHTQKS